MNANLTFAMSGFLHRTRFVVVNDRIPRTDGIAHCAAESSREVTSVIHRRV